MPHPITEKNYSNAMKLVKAKTGFCFYRVKISRIPKSGNRN